MTHPLAGRKQSPEHVARRVAAVARAKAEHTPERKAAAVAAMARTRAAWSAEQREALSRKLREKQVGIPSWNRGNDWRSKCTPEEIRSRGAARARRHRESAPRWRLNDRMSTQIYLALRQDKAGKSWESLVGYSLADLVAHLERQFVSGMTWANMGKWHIDHIVPKVAFHFTSTDEEFRRCWALSNLRPLWAQDNLKKGTKMPTEN